MKKLVKKNKKNTTSEWSELLAIIPFERAQKPRQSGLTMLLDRTLDVPATKEMISFVGPYIDHVKFSFGTSVLVNNIQLKNKIKQLLKAGINVYPGGSLFEVAYLSGNADRYFAKIVELGFDCVEISDGMINLTMSERSKVISMALGRGLIVMTEAGKKDPTKNLNARQIADIVKHDLDQGASYVIIEARESGMGVGIYDESGKVKQTELNLLANLIPDSSRIIWEAPLKSQQSMLINRFGPNVNLGNIAPADTLGLEALRRGLRWDTFEALSFFQGNQKRLKAV